MPNLLSNYVGGGKPKLITLLTSGTGTYVPTTDMARCLVRVQAGGAGGSYSGGSAHGGGGGAMVEVMVRIPIAGWSYVVGSGGNGAVGFGTSGSRSSFGPFTANAGKAFDAGGWGPLGAAGGIIGGFSGSVDADSVTVAFSGSLSGVSGGAGGASSYAGGLVGQPFHINSTAMTANMNTFITLEMANGQGNSSGGDSFYGKGAIAAQQPASDAYGAGGSGHATITSNGKGGCIEIWDFGA